MEIWQNLRRVVPEALSAAGIDQGQVAAVRLANQRETTVLWDRRTSAPLGRAIVWQDTRTAPLVEEKFDGIRTCADIPAVTVSYTGVKADGQALKFKAYRHKATNEPGKDIYTCANVSDYTVTTPAPGSYTVRSHLARH